MSTKKSAKRSHKAKASKKIRTSKAAVEKNAKIEAKAANGHTNGNGVNTNGTNGLTSAPKLLTTHEAAALIDMNSSSIVKWANEGKLKTYSTPGGHRRIAAVDLKAFVESTGGFVPPALAAIA